MNENKENKKSMKYISQLISDLPMSEFENTDFKHSSPLSMDNIFDHAYKKKTEEELTMSQDKNREKKPVKPVKKIVAIVAIVAMLSVTAFTFSQTDIMRSLFKGENKEIIDSAMFTPMESGEANGVIMTVQSMLSDGHNARIVVSVENASPITTSDDPYGPNEPMTIKNSDGSIIGFIESKLKAYSNETIQYFMFFVSFPENISEEEITISLNPTIAPISLTTNLVSNLSFVSASIPEDTVLGNATIESFQISPMGYQLDVKQESPSSFGPEKIILVFKDGSTKEFSVMSASPRNPTISPTESEIEEEKARINHPLYPANFPLFHGASVLFEDDGTLHMTGSFSELIETENLKEVVIDGITYPVG